MLFNRCGVARGKLLARHARDGGAICDSFFLILPVYSTLSIVNSILPTHSSDRKYEGN